MSNIASYSLEEIARRLGGEISRDRKGALVPGPGHSPKDRSLSIMLDSAAPDGFVVFSFAGDDAITCRDHVRSMLGLSPFKPGKGRHNNKHHESKSEPSQMTQAERSKAPNARATAAIEQHKAKTASYAPKHVTDVYTYVAKDGTPLFRVRRFEPKSFDQQRPDGNGGWIPGLGTDVKRVPYHLPELLAYPDGTVFFAEGEKDVNRIRQAELCATTISGGTTWTPELAEYFRGRDIVITPHFDKPGVEKALAAANALHDVAKTIRIVMLPGLDGGPNANDTFDWLEADQSRDKVFADICMSAPLWTPGAEVEGLAAADQIDPRKKAAPVESPKFTEGLGEWDAGEDQVKPTPRGWLLGNTFCRGFVSSLQGDGGVGKTALRYLQMLSLAAKRALTGEHVFQRCRVLIVSLEDGPDELRRRLLAARLHHHIELEDIRGWLFIAAIGRSGGKLVVLDDHGRPVVSDLAAKLEQTIVARQIDIVLLDPFIKTHSVSENDNKAIDEVAQVLTDLCEKYNIAIDVPHHMSKGPADPGNANKGRGASSLKDALRLVRTASVMTEAEAENLGVNEAERRRLFRVDDAKVNVAPVFEAKWFKLVGVNIGNATDLYPAGDNVQTVEPWKPPGPFTDISVPDVDAILDTIEAGLPDGNRYSDAKNVADMRAAWHVIKKHCGKAKGPAKQIIRAWVESGLLFHKNYYNPVTRKDVAGLWVDSSRRPS